MGAATISLIFIRRLFVTEDFPRPVTTPSARHAHTSTALHHKNKREREKEDFIIDPYIPNRPYTHTQSVYRRRRNWCFVVVTAHRFFFLSEHTQRETLITSHQSEQICFPLNLISVYYVSLTHRNNSNNPFQFHADYTSPFPPLYLMGWLLLVYDIVVVWWWWWWYRVRIINY